MAEISIDKRLFTVILSRMERIQCSACFYRAFCVLKGIADSLLPLAVKSTCGRKQLPIDNSNDTFQLLVSKGSYNDITHFGKPSYPSIMQAQEVVMVRKLSAETWFRRVLATLFNHDEIAAVIAIFFMVLSPVSVRGDSPSYDAARYRGYPASPKGASMEDRTAFFRELVTDDVTGFGEAVTDREFWGRIGSNPHYVSIIPAGESSLKMELPELPDDLFLDYTRTGNRYRYQSPRSRRRSILTNMVLAECVENESRFMAGIEGAVRTICSEKTWVLPAHDRELTNFNETLVTIDLGSSMTALTLSQVDWLLRDKLSPDIRFLIRDRVEHFIFKPFMAMHDGEREPHWWMKERTNNWTSVCMSGILSSAFSLIESPDIRARYLEAAEKYGPYYILSLSDDGNCSEGLAYWNYGYSYYLVMVEAARKATSGVWDMLDDDKQRRTSAYPMNVEIMPGVYPSFADCRTDTKPGFRYIRYLNRRYQFGLDYLEDKPDSPGSFHMFCVFDLDNPYAERKNLSLEEYSIPLRSSFEDADVYIFRSKKENGLSVALKGGNNAEQHNHNDLGSYVVALDGHAALLDPGGEVYTKRTFSANRYDSDVLNSFGHPVPRINGQLQKTGSEYEARVLDKRSNDLEETIVMDISGAYDVPPLSKLERTFVFSRKGNGSFTVTDQVEFSEAGQFETALITFDNWQSIDNSAFDVGEGNSRMRVTIDTGGEPFRLETVTIDEDMQVKMQPFRLGIVLANPVKTARVSVKIEPAR